MIAPTLHIAFMLIVLLAVRKRPRPGGRRAARFAELSRPWAMVK
jgi:hypothetical protein